MANTLLPVPDDIRRQQFFTVPHDASSVSRSATTTNTSLQRPTLDRTVIMKKTRCYMSMPTNSFDPLTTAKFRVDTLSCSFRNSPDRDVRRATLPSHFSLDHSNRVSGTTPTAHLYMSVNTANPPQARDRSEMFDRHESVSTNIKTLRLSELGPGGGNSSLRNRSSSSSVHWNVKPQYAAEEPSHDSDKTKAGRQLTKTSHAKSSSSHLECKVRLKRDRQTKLDRKSTSSAGEKAKRSANSPSKLRPAAILLCFLIPLGYLLLHTLEISPHMLSHELNLTALDANLQKKVFGQHIALDVISKAFSTYISREKPRKPLVLSFHGWTGVGKNHVVNIIAQELDSQAVNKIILPLHSVGYDIDSGQKLTDWVSLNVANTSVVLFIIDELGKASPEFLQGLYYLLSHWQEKIYVNSHVILILLSNTGGTAINQYMSKCVDDGRSRESITHDAVVTPLFTTTFRNTWLHNFVSSGLIDYVVPFLPLERSHVVECIEAYMRNRRMVATASVIDKVLSELRFFPADWPVFSLTGCRQVAGKVDLIVG